MAKLAYDDYDASNIEEERDQYGRADEAVSLGPLIRQFISICWRDIWLILVTVGGFVIIGAILTVIQAPKYTARASIEISSQSDAVLGERLDDSTQQEVNIYDMDRFLNSQLTILQSRAVAERVAQRLNLYSNPRFLAAMQIDASEMKNDSEQRNAVIDALMDNAKARLPVDSRIAELSFTSTDAQLSAQIVNTFAEEFIQSNLQRKFDSSEYARTFVQQQLSEARARLEASEQELNAYARDAGLIRTRDPSNSDANSQTSVTTSSLMQLNEAANNAQERRVAAEGRWAAEKAQPLLSSPAALASPSVQELLNKRSEIQASLDSARQRYLGDHPTIQKLSSELDDINVQLNAAATQARNAVRADFVAAQSAEQRLRGQVSQLEAATLHEQDQSVRYNTLARESDTNRSIYDGLLQRYRELNASAGITASNISIIDRADPPEDPSSPNVMFNLFAALAIGCIAAAITVFLKDQLDDRIRVPEEVEEKVGIPLLGVIPEAGSVDPIEALKDPKSVISESYSSLRSALLYSTSRGLPNLILVTSAQPSEGKSTTSFALARSMALIGKKTLLVDADLRRPSIHRVADVKNDVGLSNLLVGEKQLADVVHAGDVANFDVIPAGPIPPSPAELLSSQQMVALFKQFREHYDFVVIDSAPVLGLADSPGLSALADGVLLIIEANRGRGGQLKGAVRRLRLMKPTILGAALTKFNPEAAGNAYSTYYHYDYYQYRATST